MSLSPNRLREFLRQWLPRGYRIGSRPVRIGYRRLFVLPTRGGAGFGFMLMLIVLAATNYSNSMTFALGFLLIGVGLVLTLHCFRNLLGIEAVASPAPPVFVGETARFPIQLHNDRSQPRIDLQISVNGSIQAFTDIEQGASRTVNAEVPALSRGTLAAPRVRLQTRFPGGLINAWSWLVPDVQCVVYPRPEPGAVPLPDASGGASSGYSARNGGDDFHGLRDYRAGDALRQVQWRNVARGQPPQTKLFSGGSTAELWLDWSSTDGMELEARLSRLCRWVVDCEADGRNYGLRLPSIEYPPSRGESHYHRCLGALAVYGI